MFSADALQEMLFQMKDGKIRLFPAVPKTWTEKQVSFYSFRGEKGILFFVQFHAARIPCCVRREDYVEERPQPACLGKWLCLKDIRASAGDLMVA